MSTVEAKPVSNCCNAEPSQHQQQQNTRRSFVITVDDNGQIGVSPSGESERQIGHQLRRNSCRLPSKKFRSGKQRIRIALLEEREDGSSSDEELCEDDAPHKDMISVDAQALGTMHDRFVKIYNKNLQGKPSFVVLEDALVRKRVEQTMQGHSNAEQQTMPGDMSAHMGSQTDEFLGHSRGCQATDTSSKLPDCPFCRNYANPGSINMPRRLSQLCALQVANRLRQQSAEAAPHPNVAAATPVPVPAPAPAPAQSNTAPHLTISFLPANMESTLPQQQQQPSQQQQQQQQPQPMPAALTFAGCCPQVQPVASYYNCCLPMAAPCQCKFCQQQLQQHLAHTQQQHTATATACPNCCSSCCLLRPAIAQTMLGFGQAHGLASRPCVQPVLLMPNACPLQQRLLPLECPFRNCPFHPANNCLCHSMANLPQCSYCSMLPQASGVFSSDSQVQQQQQQQQPQQQQQQVQQQQQQQFPQQRQPHQSQPQQTLQPQQQQQQQQQQHKLLLQSQPQSQPQPQQQHQEQQTQKQQKPHHKQYLCPEAKSCMDVRLTNAPESRLSARQLRRKRSKKICAEECVQQHQHQQQQQQQQQQQHNNQESADASKDSQDVVQAGSSLDDSQDTSDAPVKRNVLEVTVWRMKPPGVKQQPAKKATTQLLQQQPQQAQQPQQPQQRQEQSQHSRTKAGGSCQPTKVYMARFGRTCLILKPTSTAMPNRHISKRVTRYASWPNKSLN